MEKCYVCGNYIKENPLYIGQGLFRHSRRCSPGKVLKMKQYTGRLIEEAMLTSSQDRRCGQYMDLLNNRKKA